MRIHETPTGDEPGAPTTSRTGSAGSSRASSGRPPRRLDVEPQRWDEQRLREDAERFERPGCHETTTLAIAPDGEVLGMTEAMASGHAPDRARLGFRPVERVHDMQKRLGRP